MKSDSLEVIYLLTELTKLVKTCTEPLNSQEVSMMLNGLQGMSSDCSEVIDLLRELPQSVKSSEPQTDSSGISFRRYPTVAHRGDRNRRSTMEFLVRWEDFSDAESWEPLAVLI